MRIGQWVSCCHAGLSIQAEHPLPAPHHAVSCQTPFFDVSLVPPTAIIWVHEAGNCAGPKPKSPDEATCATPGCV